MKISVFSRRRKLVSVILISVTKKGNYKGQKGALKQLPHNHLTRMIDVSCVSMMPPSRSLREEARMLLYSNG